MSNEIRVLVVDDSAFMRHTIVKQLTTDTDIIVVDTARDGLEALEKIASLKPDVVTLDIEMPRMDGLTALRQIMSTFPTPVVMLSSLTAEGAETTLKALELGAVDFVLKPSGSVSLDIYKVRLDLVNKVRQAARLDMRRIRRAEMTIVPTKAQFDRERAFSTRCFKVVVIGSSTGGPKALYEVVPRLPADLRAAVLIVQHMPPGFTRSLANRLNEVSRIHVKEGEIGDVVAPGQALVAPGNYHLVVEETGTIGLVQSPQVHGVRPAVDVTMESVAKVYKDQTVGVVLTGMGSDGSKGAALIRQAGGKVIAEHESSCVVYGMPRCVVEEGNADKIALLESVSDEIVRLVGGRVHA